MRLPIQMLGGLFVFWTIGMSFPAIAAEPAKVTGKIASVTIYRDQARVVREIDVPALKESQTILVDELPNHFMEQSLYTESDSGTVVQGLRVRSANDNSKSQGNEKADKLQKELASAKHDLLVIEEDLSTLESLVAFSSKRFERDLGESKLDVQSVTTVSRLFDAATPEARG